MLFCSFECFTADTRLILLSSNLVVKPKKSSCACSIEFFFLLQWYELLQSRRRFPFPAGIMCSRKVALACLCAVNSVIIRKSNAYDNCIIDVIVNNWFDWRIIDDFMPFLFMLISRPYVQSTRFFFSLSLHFISFSRLLLSLPFANYYLGVRSTHLLSRSTTGHKNAYHWQMLIHMCNIHIPCDSVTHTHIHASSNIPTALHMCYRTPNWLLSSNKRTVLYRITFKWWNSSFLP